MILFPRHGVCYSVLLLSSVALLAARDGVSDWVRAAREHGAHLAAATDLASPAESLISCGLASVNEGAVVISQGLTAIVGGPSNSALRGTAILLLAAQPPAWLCVAVRAGEVRWDYIPHEDLAALRWLGDDLGDVLIESRSLIRDDDLKDLSKAIGDAAEEFCLAGFRYAGLPSTHVARISNFYGYDIEVHADPVQRWEVKGAGPRTSGGVYLSRHEFETSQRFSESWRLLQVVFTGSAFVADVLTSEHVGDIRELSASMVRGMVPPDTSQFSWRDTAIVTPPADAWTSSTLILDPEFTRPGFLVR